MLNERLITKEDIDGDSIFQGSSNESILWEYTPVKRKNATKKYKENFTQVGTVTIYKKTDTYITNYFNGVAP